MNREVFQSSLMQQQMMMDESNPKWWSISNTRTPPGHGFSDLLHQPPPSSSSTDTTTTTVFPHYLTQPSGRLVSVASLPDSHDLPADSWSQLLLGGIVGEEEKYELSLLQPKRTDNWEEDEQQAMQPPLISAPTAAADHVSGYFHGNGSEEEDADGILSWRQILPAAAAVASSPQSCMTTSLCSSMLDFSNSSKRHHPDTECNSTSTGEAHKKPRVQVSSAQCAFKVRKEKLGDRITALHQLVSPFGKTDTASVLLEAIGYIRFLQSQIEALSTPYLGCGSGNKGQPVLLREGGTKKRGPQNHQEEEDEKNNNDEQPKKKDLKSRGLCLVPVSFTLHVGNETSTADYWAPAFTSGGGGGGGFR